MDQYLDSLHRDKSRYYRDNLTYIDKHYGSFSKEIMREAFDYCRQRSIYNATILIEVAQALQRQSTEKPIVTRDSSPLHAPDDYNIVPQKTDINVFNAIFQ